MYSLLFVYQSVFHFSSWKFSRGSITVQIYKMSDNNYIQDPLSRSTPHVDEISVDQQLKLNVTDTLYSPNNVDTKPVGL